ncbi:hypothetical protein M3Y94_00725600 [Aphelenchoides besseyi]|nr:hypothetical protein M3Y94_00725600 [Aphelenchoides besseyi]
MFRKLQKMVANKPPPEYDAPVQKRIQLLETVRALAAGIVSDCTAISKLFDQPDGPLHNVSENLAINLKMLANVLKEKDSEYSEFLLELNAIYDEVGRAQRKFQSDLKEQIIDPLNAWLLTDYKRMKMELTKLNDLRDDADRATEKATKVNAKREHLIKAEQTRKEFERQMEIVKEELLKLSTIKNDHAGLFYNFLEIQKTYHGSMVAIMEGKNVETWVPSMT